MSNRLDEATLRARYEAGVKAHKRQQQQRRGEVTALVIAVSTYDEIARNRRVEKMAHAAQLFCIAAAFVIPNLLFMAYAL